MAVLAITIGWIIIVPPFVSWYRTFKRIQRGAAGCPAHERGESDPRLHSLRGRPLLPAGRVALRTGRAEQALARAFRITLIRSASRCGFRPARRSHASERAPAAAALLHRERASRSARPTGRSRSLRRGPFGRSTGKEAPRVVRVVGGKPVVSDRSDPSDRSDLIRPEELYKAAQKPHSSTVPRALSRNARSFATSGRR